MIGLRKEWQQSEDSWLQDSEATGGQDVPLLLEACWRTVHDAAYACVRACVTLSVKTHR